MRSLHLPPPSGALTTTDGFGFLADLLHMRNVATRPYDRVGGFAAVTFVGAQILSALAARLGSPNDNAVQRFGQQFDVMPVGSADDKRELSLIHI